MTVLDNYKKSLSLGADWLLSTIYRKKGGSAAVVWCFGKSSPAYPETTGYIIKTLIDYAAFSSDTKYLDAARQLGDWLLRIQQSSGAWFGGVHPPKNPQPSVFNTAQILIGLVALHAETGESKWLEAAEKGANWLGENINDSGRWDIGNYQSDFNPSYYTRVAWPMLLVWSQTGGSFIKDKSLLALNAIAANKAENGVIAGWGFKPNSSAFTHTIAYTIRGFLESQLLLGDDVDFVSVVRPAIEKLIRATELNAGRLAGAFDEQWRPNKSFVCLTGSVQTAICFMMYSDYEKKDLRILNAATKLIDYVCSKQRKRFVLPSLNGAIGGSSPIWGSYMRFRYPNWAAKFFCDALMMLILRYEEQGLK